MSFKWIKLETLLHYLVYPIIILMLSGCTPSEPVSKEEAEAQLYESLAGVRRVMQQMKEQEELEKLRIAEEQKGKWRYFASDIAFATSTYTNDFYCAIRMGFEGNLNQNFDILPRSTENGEVVFEFALQDKSWRLQDGTNGLIDFQFYAPPSLIQQPETTQLSIKFFTATEDTMAVQLSSQGVGSFLYALSKSARVRLSSGNRHIGFLSSAWFENNLIALSKCLKSVGNNPASSEVDQFLGALNNPFGAPPPVRDFQEKEVPELAI